MPQNFGTCQTCGRSVVDLLVRLAEREERASDLETMLRELVTAFNPEPAKPPLTIWDRAAAVLAGELIPVKTKP